MRKSEVKFVSLTIDTLLDQYHITNPDDFIVAIVTELYQTPLTLDKYLRQQKELIVNGIPIKLQQKSDGIYIVSFNHEPVDLLFMY